MDAQDNEDLDTLMSLAQELERIHYYPRGLCGDFMLEGLGLTGLSFRQAALQLANCNVELSPRLYAAGLCALAHCVGHGGSVQLLNSHVMNQYSLCCEALESDPSYAFAHFQLAIVNNAGVSRTISLKDGQVLQRDELLRTALRLNSDLVPAYTALAKFESSIPDRQRLCLEALQRDASCCDAFYELALTIPNNDQRFTFPPPRSQSLLKHELMIEALQCHDPRIHGSKNYIYFMLSRCMPPEEKWTQRRHAAGIFRGKTNTLFATLFLGLQRLETMGVLPLAHQAMLEDMLEGWTWADHQQ